MSTTTSGGATHHSRERIRHRCHRGIGLLAVGLLGASACSRQDADAGGLRVGASEQGAPAPVMATPSAGAAAAANGAAAEARGIWVSQVLSTSMPTFVSGLAVSRQGDRAVVVTGDEERGYVLSLLDGRSARPIATRELPLLLSADDTVMGSEIIVLAGQADPHGLGSSLIAVPLVPLRTTAPAGGGKGAGTGVGMGVGMGASAAKMARRPVQTLGATESLEAYRTRLASSPDEHWVAAVAVPASGRREGERGAVTVAKLPELAAGELLAVPGAVRCEDLVFTGPTTLTAACHDAGQAWSLALWDHDGKSWRESRRLAVRAPSAPIKGGGRDDSGGAAPSAAGAAGNPIDVDDQTSWQVTAMAAAAAGDRVCVGWAKGSAGAVSVIQVAAATEAPAPISLKVPVAALACLPDRIIALTIDGRLCERALAGVSASPSWQVLAEPPEGYWVPEDVPPPRGFVAADGRAAVLGMHALEEGAKARVFLWHAQ